MKQYPLRVAKIFTCLFIPIRVRGVFLRCLFESMWRRVWIDEGYADFRHISLIADHYREYRKSSIDIIMTFLLIPVGTLRLILKKERNLLLPVEKDFNVVSFWKEGELVVEVTLLTTIKYFRKMFAPRILALIMMRYSYQKSLQIGAKAMVVAADRRLYALLTRIIRLPFHQIGESRYYEGSITVPAIMFLEEAEEVMPSRNPYIYKLFQRRIAWRNKNR